MADTATVGIIGAGLSGLMAGRILQDHGLDVTLFDKGRRPGGRANTREHGAFRFDHGAQYFTVRDPRVRPLLEAWVRRGIASEWTAPMVRINGDTVEPAQESRRFVGVPGMIDLAGDLARGLEIRNGLRVDRLRREGSKWSFLGGGGSIMGRFDLALVAVPAPQAMPLLSGAPELREAAGQIEMAPCWTGMYVFEEPVHLEFAGAFVADGPFSWAARNSSKPGRPALESWVVHARPDWTPPDSVTDPGAVARLLLEEFRTRFGPLSATVFQRAHRWGFALASGSVPGGALFDPESGIGACGDWCQGGRVEGALLSGLALAVRILRLEPSQLSLDRWLKEETTR